MSVSDPHPRLKPPSVRLECRPSRRTRINPRDVTGSDAMASYSLRVNGAARTVESADADKPLLYVLREIGLTGTKFGCGLGQCGACTVIIDGVAMQSCQMTVADAQGKTITTI